MIAFVFALAALAAQQDDFDKVEVTSAKVAEGIYVLNGRGGNIGVSVGEDGVFLIDDQYAPLTTKIRAAVSSLTPQPIRFVVNTHWHGDHTGGNENLGKMGIVIVAHENVRKRMSVEQFLAAFNQKVPASPKAALPIITFADSVTFNLNGDEIRSFHVAPAHTDGDTVVYFKKANVVHMGDCFFNGMYPFIDLSSGGSIDGVIAAADKVLGHGGHEHEDHPGSRAGGGQGGPPDLPGRPGHRARPGEGAGRGGQDPRRGEGGSRPPRTSTPSGGRAS